MCRTAPAGQVARWIILAGQPGLSMRYFYAWKKYPYKSRHLAGVRSLANNLIHKICAELTVRPLLVAEVAPVLSFWPELGAAASICPLFAHGNKVPLNQ